MHPRILNWNIAIVAVLTDFTNMAVMLSDLLRNLNFNRSLHCTQESDQWPLGLLLIPFNDKRSHYTTRNCSAWPNQCWFGVTSNVFKGTKMDHFSKVHTSQPSCNNPFPFLFSESHIFLPQIQAHNPSFFRSGIRINFFLSDQPHPNPCFVACYNALYHLLSHIGVHLFLVYKCTIFLNSPYACQWRVF